MERESRHGFTLLELSVVLVIIGLVAGGVMAGQSLLRASKLRNVVTKITEYRTAIDTFHLKYGWLPGDMPNATQYWGAQDADATACMWEVSTDQKTCDGNGDGYIRYSFNTFTDSEKFRLWQQLANAGMITGSYTGATDGGGIHATAGVNVPAGPLTNSGFSMEMGRPYYGDANAYPSGYGNMISFGAPFPNAGMTNAVLTPAEAQSIDSKLDDGLPAKGNVMTPTPSSWLPNCATSNNPEVAAYNISATTIECSLNFKLQNAR